MTRTNRRNIAAETVAILDEGSYLAPSGERVDLREALEWAKAGSVHLEPRHLWSRRDEAVAAIPEDAPRAVIELRDETTFGAARRIVCEEGRGDVAALNFASAKRPGGGFLNGAQAQEECLARASGLYPCLLRAQTMYAVNRGSGSTLYADDMIWSPGVPVFRDDADALLEAPYEVGIITAPSANLGAMKAKERGRNVEVMRGRAELVCGLAASLKVRELILGAWGCGVFRQDPVVIARLFRAVLDGPLGRAFARVTFAIPDVDTKRGNNLEAFELVFGQRS